ncbi:MAG: electron transfer flavoprotein subunit alpha/FixB family protein [Actinomycetales bacterium]|nr:electron transfer flavoprotein subunit alpha/FixB family protein [Actinomycetales bacterium]
MSGTTTANPVLALLAGGDQDALEGPDAELLGVARAVAAALGAPLEVVWSGALTDGALEELGAAGVGRVHRLTSASTSSSELAGALGELFATASPAALLATTSFESRELAARLGARLGAGVLVDALRLEVTRGRIVAERTSFAASWRSRCEVMTAPAVITVKPHATVLGVTESGVAAVGHTPEVLDLAPGAPDPRVRVVERTPRVASGRPDLATAATVVVGGRGTQGDFTLLEELADVLGGSVGATRVAVDEGWVGHELQVGQTGVTINPVLYIGAGVSGAIHHVGGMRAAQTVVAVNEDPDAPLMELADYAIVGDLTSVLPRLTARLRELHG